MVAYNKPLSDIYHFLLILFFVKYSLSKEAILINSKSTLPTCPDYVESRSAAGNSPYNPTIFIPETRTSRITSPGALPAAHINFPLRVNQKLKCTKDTAKILTIPLEVQLDVKKLGGRNFSYASNETTEAHSHSYFTSTGYFYDNSSNNYYNPDGDYCVKSYSSDSISLRVCTANKDCSISSSPNAWCFPKCCAVDEVLLYWEKECVRINETDGITPWIPPIYDTPGKLNHKMSNVSNNLIFHLASLPKNCTPAFYKGTLPIYTWTAAAPASHPETGEYHEKDNIKLLQPSGGSKGMIQVLGFFEDSRRWKLLESWTDFCVEGFFVKSPESPIYTGNENEFVIFYCDEEVYQHGDEDSEAHSWLYTITSLVALVFLLATIIIYVALWDKQNLHGLTILSYTVATFGSYLFFTAAQMVFLFPNEDMTGLHTRGAFCYGNSILAHYFFIAGYTWLTVMNFDLWLTFNSLRASRRDTKEWKKFGIYSSVAWTIPLILIIAFVIVDNVYRDPLSLVPVPEYGMSTCFVAPEFRGEYIYAPMAILLGINIILICMTMKIFILARSQNNKTFAGGASNATRYSYVGATLFCKLFIFMGGTSIVDFLTWYYNNAGVKPWIIVILECIAYLTPILLFILFCLNDRVINQIREKYPRFSNSIQPVFQLFTKRDDDGMGQPPNASNKTSFSTVDTQEREAEVAPLRTFKD